MNQYYILKPKNLNLEHLVNKYTPNFNFNIDFAHFIFHLMIIYQNENTEDSITRLSSKFLQKMNRNYNLHIDFLLENFPCNGSVLKGNRYSVNKPFGYRFSNYYNTNEFEIYTIIDKVLVPKIKKIFSIKINENLRLQYYFLLKHFKKDKLTASQPSILMNEINALPDKKKRIRNAKNIIKIMNGEYSCTLKPKTDGRVHSNITRLSKISRKYLQHNGEYLAEVDISSAVPFILFLTMKMHLDNNLSYLASNFQYSNTITYMLDEVTGDVDKSELRDFGTSVISGSLYEQFSNLILNEKLYTDKGYKFEKVVAYYNYSFKKQFGYNFDGDKSDLKKFAKKRMLSMIFAKSTSYTFEQIVFKELYPSILKFINEFKNVEQYKDDESTKIAPKDKHKKLAYFCFQFEAKMMIDKIAREFDKIHNGKIPIYSLHDCIITTNSNVEMLNVFMQNKFIEMFGIAPNLTIEKSHLNIVHNIAS